MSSITLLFKAFYSRRDRSGSALVLTLLVVSLLLVMTLAFTVTVRMELRNVLNWQHLILARANARLGTELAIAQLQELTGPDQRVTAPADILSDAATVDASQSRRVGVWDSSTWSPFTPGSEGSFLGWLSSARNAQGGLRTETSPTAVTAPVSMEARLVGPTSAGASAANWAWAQKIPFALSGREDAYAFVVLDEGVKARADLARPANSNTDLTRFRQFESPPGVGLENMEPFASQFSEPLRENLDGGKLASTRQLPFLDTTSLLPESFEQTLFHDITLHSRGLLTDVRSGGLKEDLNLLFEMDDTAYFASEYGEASPPGTFLRDGVRTSESLRRRHRTLYLLHSGNFSFSFNTSGLHLPGPSFATLRDHYRAYQKTRKIGDRFFATDAQPFEPPLSNLQNHFPKMYSFEVDDHYYNSRPDHWVGRQRGIRLAPTVLRYQMLFSFKAEPYNGNWQIDDGSGVPKPATHYLTLIASPILVLWNPYDVVLDFQGMTVHQPTSIFPISFNWEVLYGSRKAQSNANPFTRMVPSGADWGPGPKFSFAHPNGVRLQPGEIKVFGLANTETQDFTTANQGFDLAPGFRSTGGFRVDRLLTKFGTVDKRWDYYNSAGVLQKDPAQKILLNADSRLALEGISQIGGDGNWPSQYFLQTYLVHFGSYDKRFNVDGWNGQHVSPMQSAGIITSRSNIISDIGNIGRLPQDSSAYFDDTVWLDRRDFGMLDLQARAADSTDKPAKLFGPYNPNAWVMTSPWIHNRFSETMLGPYSFKAAPLPNGQFEVIDHDFSTSRGYWGGSYSDFNGSHFVVAYQLPKTPIWSLGALQHVNGLGTFAFEPSHTIGNSFASPLIPFAHYLAAFTCWIDSNKRRLIVGDLSYLSNAALWDKYFFSSLAPETAAAFASPRSMTKVVDDVPARGLPNPRMTLNGSFQDFKRAVLDSPDAPGPVGHWKKPARFLTVDGAFNINSTSRKAWIALLTSLRGENLYAIRPQDGSTELHEPQGTLFPRSTLPAGREGELWSGFRELSDDQIEDLATGIVKEVIERGPFMSLSHFVNRSLEDSEKGKSGALQTAIEAAALNSGFGSTTIPNSKVSEFPNTEAASGPSAQGASGFLTQADLLQVIAPLISARSDTFKIRAYGRMGSATGSEVNAWCEVVVQRTADYVDPVNSPWAKQGDVDFSVVNQRFGRRYRILSFRWLSENEI